MKRLLGTTAALIFAASLAQAAEVTQTIDTTAAPPAVWKVIGAFDSIGTWLPGVVSSPADNGNKLGSVRLITLKAPGSPTVKEKLTARNGHAHTYSYAILAVDPKVLPVKAYTSTITVAKTATGSTVTWHADFTPAGGADEAAADKAVSGLYQSGLTNIKALAEK